jgi:hypothetical protein
MRDGRCVPTQDVARDLIARGCAGLLFRRFANGATDAAPDLVPWTRRSDRCLLEVIAAEGWLDRR